MIRHARLLPLIALAVVIGQTACSDAPTAPTTALGAGTEPQLNRAAPARGMARYEIRFLQDMIDHHAMAVETAELCVARAVHEELRQLCEQIIAAQSAEIEQMQRWLEQWYGISYEPQMKPGDERMIERLASMSGAEFEIAFMQMMIEHHEAAIREAEECLRRAYHRQLQRLCENIIETQSAEIEQMQAWLCEWYGICE